MSALFGAGASTPRLFMPKASAAWSMLGLQYYNNVVLLNFALNDQELVNVERCFNKECHLFAWGRDSQKCVLQVDLIVFFNNQCNNAGDISLEELRRIYDGWRVYLLQDAAEIMIDDFTVNGYLVQMSIHDVSAERGSCIVSFAFIIKQEI